MKKTSKCGMVYSTEPLGEGSPLEAAVSRALAVVLPAAKLRGSKSAWMRILIPVAVIALTFAACNKPTGGGDPPKVIAPEWRKTFSNGDYMPNNDDYYTPTTTTLGENTITISGGDLGSPVTITGVYTQGGGPITIHDPGEWAFVYKDGVKIGYILGSYNFTNYLLHIGKVAVVNLSANESTFGVTIDLDGVPDYPSIQGIP